MELPFFYLADIPSAANELVLPEETSKHIVSVLRMQEGDEIQLTNGQGTIVRAKISIAHKKNCTLNAIEIFQSVDSRKPVTLAISLLKNPSRFEWMLEKVTEIGIRSVIPLISQRTERQHFRADRMKNIMVSAMLQSQQSWLPEIMEPVSFAEVLKMGYFENKYIAHCLPEARSTLREETARYKLSVILIGPEGDFSPSEISAAIDQGYKPVTLGDNRLRTETAGVVAATLLSIQ
jgi:16S rRNA (uracil1498-N3)-methyltransferase